MRPLVVLLLAAVLLAGCAQDAAQDPSTSTSRKPTPSTSKGPAPTTTASPTSTGTATSAPTSSASQGPEPEGNGTQEQEEPASQPRTWTEPGAATIRPGVNIVDGGCTTNFVFTSPDNATVYIGTAAHCVTHNDPNAADDGCDPASDPYDIGASIQVDGASRPGTLVYTSWGTMQDVGEGSSDACSYNDFAVVELDPADHGKVNPAMLSFGGPTMIAPAGDMQQFGKVLTYGNSGLRLGVQAASPHEGYILFTPSNGDWTAEVYTVTQGIPGDSGSGVLLGDGRAMGVLVTISYAGGSNGVTLLENAMAYAAEHAGLELRLATWEQLSDGNLPPV